MSSTSEALLAFIKSDRSISDTVLIVICIVLVLLVFTIVTNIMAAKAYPSNPMVVKGLSNGNSMLVIPQDSVPITRSQNQTGIEFSWSVWLNITNLDNAPGQYKHIFSKGDNDASANNSGMNAPNNSPGLYIAPDSNSLVVVMNTFNTIDEQIQIDDIPLKKWLHVLIRVENRFLDVYVNGSLAKRKLLASVPKQNYGNIYVAMNSGFNGYMSNLQYFDYALQPGPITALVEKGPNLKASSASAQNAMNVNPPYFSLLWYFQNSAT
jgi:hypothetical protein